MAVRIDIRYAGDVTIFDCFGNLTLGEEGSEKLREALGSVLKRGRKKILLNLGGISYVDASGIDELVSGFRAVARSGGQLKLLNPQVKVKDFLQITGLFTVFRVHEDEGIAVRSFS